MTDLTIHQSQLTQTILQDLDVGNEGVIGVGLHIKPVDVVQTHRLRALGILQRSAVLILVLDDAQEAIAPTGAIRPEVGRIALGEGGINNQAILVSTAVELDILKRGRDITAHIVGDVLHAVLNLEQGNIVHPQLRVATKQSNTNSSVGTAVEGHAAQVPLVIPCRGNQLTLVGGEEVIVVG